jgi:hypothetical protein
MLALSVLPAPLLAEGGAALAQSLKIKCGINVKGPTNRSKPA